MEQAPRVTIRFYDKFVTRREGRRGAVGSCEWYTALGRKTPLHTLPGIDGKSYLCVMRDGKVIHVIGEILREGRFVHNKPEEVFGGFFLGSVLGRQPVQRADPAKGERELIFDFKDRGVRFVDYPAAYTGSSRGEDTYIVYRRLPLHEMTAMVPLVEAGLAAWRARPASSIID